MQFIRLIDNIFTPSYNFFRKGNLPGLVEVYLLPYNRAAGAKYRFAGMEFNPDYDEKSPLKINTNIFEQAGLKMKCV